MREEWIAIKETDERYEISNFGRARNVKSGLLLKEHDNGKGYKNYMFYVGNNKFKHLYIHRLVAQYFIENNNGYNEVNHKDENKGNNHIKNLEWCTRQYNNTYGQLTQNKMKKVNQYTLDGRYLKTFDSIMDVAKEINITVNHIGSVCQGKRKSCGGYTWKYA